MTVVSIVQPTDLLGKELRERLEARPELWSEIRLLSPDSEGFGTLTELAGAAAIVGKADADGLAGSDVVFFCGADDPAPLISALPPAATSVWMHPDAAPEAATPVVAGVNLDAARSGEQLISPHPASILLANLLLPLRRFSVTAATAVVVQPASLFEERGLDELFAQTRQIAAMAERDEPEVFGKQLAFNLLPNPTSGPMIAHQTATALASADDGAETGVPALAVRTVQGAVFHGISTAAHCELGSGAAAAPSEEEIREALGEHPVNQLAEDPQLVGPIDVAASDEVLVGEVSAAGEGFWVWAVMDNLTRGGAVNAVALLERLTGHA